MRPVAEAQFDGFMYPMVDHVICHAARFRYRTRGRLTCPMVLRVPWGGGIRAPEHHSSRPHPVDLHQHPRPARGDAFVPVKVGATAGFEASGGGFAEYIRVMDWIVRKGVVRIPDGVSYEQASFIEPVNTCLKAIESLRLEPEETVLVIGQGPIGIMLAALARRTGATVVTSDLYPQRLKMSESFGLRHNVNASQADPVERVRELTQGRGADAVILATAGNSLIRPAMDAARPGGRVMLFAQTQRSEVSIDPSDGLHGRENADGIVQRVSRFTGPECKAGFQRRD